MPRLSQFYVARSQPEFNRRAAAANGLLTCDLRLQQTIRLPRQFLLLQLRFPGLLVYGHAEMFTGGAFVFIRE